MEFVWWKTSGGKEHGKCVVQIVCSKGRGRNCVVGCNVCSAMEKSCCGTCVVENVMWKLRGGNFCGGSCEVQVVKWKWCGRVGAVESWL